MSKARRADELTPEPRRDAEHSALRTGSVCSGLFSGTSSSCRSSSSWTAAPSSRPARTATSRWTRGRGCSTGTAVARARPALLERFVTTAANPFSLRIATHPGKPVRAGEDAAGSSARFGARVIATGRHGSGGARGSEAGSGQFRLSVNCRNSAPIATRQGGARAAAPPETEPLSAAADRDMAVFWPVRNPPST